MGAQTNTATTPPVPPLPPLPSTPKAMLLDYRLRERLGHELMTTIAAHRTAGRHWHEIADHLTRTTGVTVTRESVRKWAHEWDEARKAAA